MNVPPPEPTSARRPIAAVGGIVGPSAFIGAWVTGALLTTQPYSSIDDPISRLAAVGADTRGLMTAGFVVFGLAVPVYATAVRPWAGLRASVAAVVAGFATLAVAGLPLDRSVAVDRWHGIAAGIGYLALAAIPLSAFGPLRPRGRSRLAIAGVAAGALSLVALALSATALPTGLFQRVGLTVTDAWIVASAVVMLRSPATAGSA